MSSAGEDDEDEDDDDDEDENGGVGGGEGRSWAEEEVGECFKGLTKHFLLASVKQSLSLLLSSFRTFLL